MKDPIKWGLLAFLLVTSPMMTNCFISIGNIGTQFFDFVLQQVFSVTWNPIDDLLHPKVITLSKIGAQLEKVIEKLNNLSLEFKEAVKDVKNHVTLELKTSKILDLQEKIEGKFKLTMEYVMRVDKLENVTIEERIIDLTQGPDAIENLVTLFHTKVFGRDTLYLESIIKAIHKNKRHFAVNTTTPEEVVLYKFYLTMLSVEYKAMILQKISCFLKFRMGKGNFTMEMEIYEKHFKDRVQESLERMRHSFLTASRDLYKHDPDVYKRGANYDEVTRFNQIYFTSEWNFESCYSRCEDYSKPRHNYSESYKYPHQRQCRGTIHSCRSEYTNDYHVWISDHKNDKRYQYVAMRQSYDRFSPGYRYGTFKHVSNNARIVDFKGWTHGFGHCDICRCQCDEPNDQASVRLFSMSPLSSDIDRNMVVTGVRIVRHDKIFSLEIHQAPLLPMGKVNDSASTSKVSTPDDIKKNKLFKLQYNKTSVFIGKAKVSMKNSPYFVVTGVRFGEKNGHLALEVTFTKFNYTTGKLADPKVRENIMTKVNHNVKKNIISGRGNQRPVLYTDNVPSTETKAGLVQFSPSNLFDDVGQSTIPFLDTQLVKSSCAALVGVGLQFRTRDKSGGFIAPILVTYPMYIGNKDELEG